MKTDHVIITYNTKVTIDSTNSSTSNVYAEDTTVGIIFALLVGRYARACYRFMVGS